MKIKLSEKQLKLIRIRMKANLKEAEELRLGYNKGLSINGWDFANLSNEYGELEYVLNNGYVEIK